MTYTIAVSGKGGTGKTTFTGLLIDYLMSQKKPILAVDADPNANLHEVLGVGYDRCIADIRDDTLKQLPEYKSMPKDRLIEYLLHQTLVEREEFDLLVMGRPEGQHCYCFVNSLLRRHLDVLSDSYDYIIMDNEAGMEHLSRMTTRDVDLLIIISDPSVRGLRTAVRISELVEELAIPVSQHVLMINKVRPAIEKEIIQRAKEFGFSNIFLLPEDATARRFDEEGKPLAALPTNNPLKEAIKAFGQQISKKDLVGSVQEKEKENIQVS
ncbi:MAG: AAA family ATPase [Candidatus Heimdallarchaeota archaeon]|nr:AAA family ATPase [Candidatus Heimdallarchaeota archaeon]